MAEEIIHAKADAYSRKQDGIHHNRTTVEVNLLASSSDKIDQDDISRTRRASEKLQAQSGISHDSVWQSENNRGSDVMKLKSQDVAENAWKDVQIRLERQVAGNDVKGIVKTSPVQQVDGQAFQEET